MGRPASRAISGSSGVYPYAKPAGSLANRPLASWSMPSPAGSMDANPTSPGSTNIPSLSRPCERIHDKVRVVIFLPLYSIQSLHLWERITNMVHPVVEALGLTLLEIKRQPGEVAAGRQQTLRLTRRT